MAHGGLQLNIWIFADVYVQASATRTIQVQVGAPSQIVSTTTSTTATNSTAQSARAQTGVQTSSTTSLSVSPSNFGAASAALLLIAIVLVGLLAVLLRRRKTQIQPKPEVIPASSEPSSAAAPTAEHEQTAPASERVLPTGYEELDRLLRGGLPTGRAILLISGPWDEKELLFNKIIESGLIHGDYVYFLSRDLGRSQDLARKHPQRFYVLTPRADNISGQAANIFKISDIANLNDVNISISKVMEMIPNISDGKIIVIDFLSDVLLEHGGVTTRKWLDEFLTRRESEGFMVIASLNPLIVREQESQQIIDLFDGVIEIFEITGRPRRFLIVRKMSGRKYAETELSLNKDKLY